MQLMSTEKQANAFLCMPAPDFGLRKFMMLLWLANLLGTGVVSCDSSKLNYKEKKLWKIFSAQIMKFKLNAHTSRCDIWYRREFQNNQSYVIRNNYRGDESDYHPLPWYKVHTRHAITTRQLRATNLFTDATGFRWKSKFLNHWRKNLCWRLMTKPPRGLGRHWKVW